MRTRAVGYADGTRLPWHTHDWHQLVYPSAGVLVVETGASRWVVPPARAVWVPANVTHRLTARGKVDLRTVYVARHLRAAPRALGVIEVSPLLRELVLRVVQRGMLGKGSLADERLCRVLLDELATVDVAPLVVPTPTDGVASEVAQRLHDEPGADLEALARHVGVSRRTLERRFRAETGLSLGEWRQRLQLLRAIEMLAAGRSASDAAWAVGYRSASAFGAAFRRQLGTTPGRYFRAS